MKQEQIFSAQNVDRAIEKALDALHLDRDAVSVEVIEMGRKGLFGIGASDAKIRVTYEVPDAPKPSEAPKAQPEKAQPVEKTEAPRPARPAREQDGTPRLVKAAPHDAAPAPARPEKPAREEEKPRLVRRANGEKPAGEPAPKAEAPKAAAPAEEKPDRAPRPAYVRPEAMPEAEWPEQAKEAIRFIDGLLDKLGVEGHAYVTAQSEPDHLRLEIEGPDMGPVIGRRGDTLDAIQYLTSLVLNRGTDEHIRLTIDTENYRVKRAESLERLARKMAGKVSRYHKPMTLEPMNPYERRIIHSALQDYRGVTTHSTGTEPNRRVVISPEGGRKFSGRRPRQQ